MLVLLLFEAADRAWQTRKETDGGKGKDKRGSNIRPKEQRNVANKTVIAAAEWMDRTGRSGYFEPCCSSYAPVIVELRMAMRLLNSMPLIGALVYMDMTKCLVCFNSTVRSCS